MPAIIEQIGESFRRMSDRERIMVLGLAGTAVVLVLALLSFLILDGLDTREMHNERLRQVIRKLEKNRGRLMASKREDARLDVKLDRKPPALQGHIETIAERLKVEIKGYSPPKEKELGKRKLVLQKSVTISLYDIGLAKLMKFVNALESGGYLIMVTQLQVVPRSTDHGRLDVKKLQVSSYERNEPKRRKKRTSPRRKARRRNK